MTVAHQGASIARVSFQSTSGPRSPDIADAHRPLRTIDDIEWITAGWVDWYNARRLHSTLGDVPPDEFDAAYYAGYETPSHPVMATA